MVEGVLTIVLILGIFLVFTHFSRQNLQLERQITSSFDEFKDRIEDRSAKKRFREAYLAYLWAGYDANTEEERKAMQRAGECLTSEHEEDWQESVVSKWEALRATTFDKIARYFQRHV